MNNKSPDEYELWSTTTTLVFTKEKKETIPCKRPSTEHDYNVIASVCFLSRRAYVRNIILCCCVSITLL